MARERNMWDAPSIFAGGESPWNEPLARKTDPETSSLGAEHARDSGLVGRHHKIILGIVGDFPGRTARELSSLAVARGIDDPQGVHKRIAELERLGLVRRDAPRRCRITGRPARVIYLEAR